MRYDLDIWSTRIRPSSCSTFSPQVPARPPVETSWETFLQGRPRTGGSRWRDGVGYETMDLISDHERAKRWGNLGTDDVYREVRIEMVSKTKQKKRIIK